MHILVTGATGYIGGRLVPRLLDEGHQVRVLVRDPQRITGRPWSDAVEVVQGDLLTGGEALKRALSDVDTAYYLVHSMAAGHGFASRDRQAAENFATHAQHLKLVIYLGGLLPVGDQVSDHLHSRAETGAILRRSLPVTEFRAGPIIGSGSASFEMVRYLTERLPAMVAPRWILNQVQPVAIRDVLSYLVAAAAQPPLGIVDIGSDRLTFKEMMEVYASVHRLKRVILPVPVLAPGLAALWVGLVTPIPNRLAVPLIEGVVSPILADTSHARAAFPSIEPIPYRRAVELARGKIENNDVETRWTNALGGVSSTYDLVDWEGMIREVRSRHVGVPPQRLFDVFSRLGGKTGWLVWEWAWEIRGFLDHLLGGPGLRRGRRDPLRLLPGEPVDFWRVEAVEPGHLLRLRAEMKVPGRAWLEWRAVPDEGGSRLIQTAYFRPDGLAGILYWKCLYPLHKLIFSDMANAIAHRALHPKD